MTKIELRSSKQALEKERNKLNEQLTHMRDRRIIQAEKLAALRSEEFSHSEARKTLGNKESSKPALKVLGDQITQVRILIETTQKELEVIDKDYIVLESKIKALDGSIKELSQA